MENMKMHMRLAIQLVLVAAFSSVALTNAATYTVGGTGAGWSVPSSNGAYNTWASTISFAVGDIIVFNFPTGAHDVATVTKADYDDCDDDTPIALVSTGPASINLTTSGMNYFICTIGNHCEGGQKLAVNVTATTSGTGPTPTPPSSTASPPGATTSPPPPSPPGATTSPPPPSTIGATSPPPPAGNSASAVAGGSLLAGLVGTVVIGMMMA